MSSKKPAHKLTLKAQDVFFPAACVAAIVLSVMAQLVRMGFAPWAHKLTGLGHAHEMLFGFVLALICGYTLGKVPVVKLLSMLLLWLLARIMFLLSNQPIGSEIFNIGFSLWVVWHILPRFMVAKKWRNRMIIPLLLAIFSFPMVWFLGHHFVVAFNPQYLYQSLLILLLMLMTFIAGRMLAPALAGDMQIQGFTLKARVQPRIEGALLVLPAIGSMWLFLPVNPLITAFLLVAMGTLITVRMWRWQFWRCYQRSDLMALVAGYAWLLLGALLLAYVVFIQQYNQAFLHVITMGAVGTLSSVVILKYALPRRSYPAMVFYPSMLLILLATVARVWADVSLYRDVLLSLSVFFWSLNYLMVLCIWLHGVRKKTLK